LKANRAKFCLLTLRNGCASSKASMHMWLIAASAPGADTHSRDM
jgi:hypothetical protein